MSAKTKTADRTDESQPGDETPLNGMSELVERAEGRKAAREEREEELANIDRDSIDKILKANEFGKGGKIRIKRKGQLDQTYQYVAMIKSDDWDNEGTIEWCKKMFGGGDYHCQTFRANGAMYKPFTFSIDYRYKGQLDEAAIKQLSETPGKDSEAITKVLDLVSKRDDGMKSSELLSVMQDSSKTNMQMMMMMMTMQQKSAEQQSLQTMQMMTAMMTAMTSAMAGKQTSGTDNLLLELIKQKQERSPMSETLEMMAQIKDLFDKPPKEEEKDDMFTKIVKIGAPLLSGLVGGVPSMAQPAARPQVSSAPAGQAQAQAEEAPRLGGLYATLPLTQRMFFDSMFGAASRNADPAIYADLIIDQTPPDQIGALKETLTGPDWCAKLFGDENAVASIRPWLEELRSIIMEYGAENPKSNESAGGPADTTGLKPA